MIADREEPAASTERRFLLTVAALLALAAGLIVRPFLGWVVFALFLGYILHPIPRALVARRVPRIVAALLGTLVGTLVVVGPFGIIVWLLSDELVEFTRIVSARGPDLFVTRLLTQVGVPAGARDALLGLAEQLLATAASLAVDALTNVTVGAILTVFLLFATLADGPKLVAWLRDSIPLSEGRRELLLAEGRRALDAIVFGVIAVALVQGATAAVGWWIFGLPQPFFWAFVLVVTSLIPYVGVYIVLFPAIAWLAATGEIVRAVGFLLFSVFIVGTVDNVVRPFLIGKRGGIHPAIVLVGVVGGVPAFGAMGVVIGPLLLSLLLSVVRVLRHPAQAERQGRERIGE